MHLITGLILAHLLRGKEQPARSPLLRLTGPIETSHLLPGRVRFRISSLVGDKAQGETVVERLQQLPGVGSVAVNEITGSVLIRYDAAALQPELLFAALARLLGLERELERAPLPILTRELRHLGEALNRAVYEQTNGFIDLWTAIPILLAFVGVRKLLQEGTATFPPGFTLVWWAYLALLRGRP